MASEEERDEKVRLNMWVARTIVEELQDIKRQTGRSVLDLVRDALWRYVREYKKEGGLNEK